MARPATLTTRQIAEIIRQRAAGKQYKEIGRLVGCSPDQAREYWRNSPLYKGKVFKRALTNKKKALEAKRYKARLDEARKKEAQLAVSILSAEIAAARREIAAAAVPKFVWRGQL